MTLTESTLTHLKDLGERLININSSISHLDDEISALNLSISLCETNKTKEELHKLVLRKEYAHSVLVKNRFEIQEEFFNINKILEDTSKKE